MKDAIHFDINLGNQCNFRCKYCFEDIMETREDSSMKQETLDNVFLFFDEVLKTENNIKLALWGGEPLLHRESVFRILEYAKRNKIHVMTYTNGSLLENYVDDLEPFKDIFKIQVSYDYEPCNTINRLRGNSEKSKKVRENILMMLNRGFQCSTKSTMTFTDLSKYLFDVYLDYEKFSEEAKGYPTNLSITPDTYNLLHDILDINSIEKQLIKLLKYFNEKKIDKPGFKWFEQTTKMYCGYPKTGALIDYDGSLFPCHGCSFIPLEYKDRYKFADIKEIKNDKDFTPKFFEHLKNFNVDNPKICMDCSAIVCFRCNVKNTTYHNYDLKSWNEKNPEPDCKFYHMLSKYVYAYRKLKETW